YEVTGDGSKEILIRLMGGADKDQYKVSAGKKVKIYDFLSTDNDLIEAGSAKLVLSDSYDLHSYNYEKPTYNIFAGHPMAGYNPDDGLKIGGIASYSINSFNSYPLLQKHTFTGNYFFATGGYELAYNGTFPKLFGKWHFVVDLLYTSPNFSVNFFGFGN